MTVLTYKDEVIIWLDGQCYLTTNPNSKKSNKVFEIDFENSNTPEEIKGKIDFIVRVIKLPDVFHFISQYTFPPYTSVKLNNGLMAMDMEYNWKPKPCLEFHSFMGVMLIEVTDNLQEIEEGVKKLSEYLYKMYKLKKTHEKP